jgi:hypothetical protein
MDLFYHAARDIELPRATRRHATQEVVRACEACGRQLEPGEPSEGGTMGLAFCAVCRARHDRSAIQIHFCDGCGVSVPLQAVEEGSALAGDGRILCQRCRVPPSRRFGLTWIVLLGLGVIAGVVAQLIL